MENDEKRGINKKLAIPEQTSDRNDYVQGIGPKEVLILAISLGIGIVVALVICISTGNIPVGMFAGVFIVGATVMAVKRDRINESMVDKISQMIRYFKSKKRYEYQYHDIFADYMEIKKDEK